MSIRGPTLPTTPQPAAYAPPPCAAAEGFALQAQRLTAQIQILMQHYPEHMPPSAARLLSELGSATNGK